jgi:hypothetical protein
MPRIVKLSDELVNAAHEAADLAHRSTSAQVEHWATLGRSMESHLTVRESGVLKQAVREPAPPVYTATIDVEQIRQRLFTALAHSATPAGQSQARRSLDALSWPQYGSNDAFPGYIVEHHADGHLVPGRYEDGAFVPATTAAAPAPKRPAPSRKAQARR